MGGFFLSLLDTINKARLVRRVRNVNQLSRGLEEYQQLTTDVLLPITSFVDNIVVSGGDNYERLKYSEQIIGNNFVQGRPMVILHLANSQLEDIVINNNFGTVINRHSKYFDAFASFDLPEICQLVLDTYKSKYDIKPAGRYILQLVYELLSHRILFPYFSSYVHCPYYRLAEMIDEAYAKGQITQGVADDFHRMLMMGQAEIPKIDTFFFEANAQMKHIAEDNPNSFGAASILSEIESQRILCIDLGSSANTLLVEIIVNSLIVAMNRGYEFTLFIDDVSVANNESLKNILCHKSNHNSVICTEDLYSLLNGKDELFTTIAGGAEKTVLLSHGSHLSCEKWSRYLGEYDKIDISYNNNAGWSHYRRIGYNMNHGQTMTDKREYKIKPEQINRLGHNEIFYYDKQTNSLVQTVVT